MASDVNTSKDPALLLKLLRDRKKAAAQDGGAGESRGQARETIPRCDRSRPLPASFAQERLWLLDRLAPGGSAFNMPVPLRLRGRLDTSLLARALGEIERRHESLRTTFQVWEDGVFQVLNEPRFHLEELDLEAELAAAADPATLLQEHIARAARFAFDLERGPLYRALLLRLGSDDHVLVINLHHVISDGWSTGVLFRELRLLLEAFHAGKKSPLEELPVQCADVAAWQRSPAFSAEFARQIDYWRARLSHAAPTLALPTDRPRPAKTGERNGSVVLALDAGITAALRSLASHHGCSLFMPLLTAFKILLYRLAGQEDILVGTPVAGRNRRELENLIGIFLNTLVLRTTLGADLTFRQALLRVRDTVLGATSHQDVPFEKLLIELQPERQLNQTPFFQVFFNMANIPDLRFELPGLEVSFEKMPELGSKFDLNLYVLEEGQGLALSLVYNPDLFDRIRVREMLAQFRAILEQAIAEPERQVLDFDLLTAEARRRLPDPRAPLADAWPGSVVELLQARAAAQPQVSAIEDAHLKLTYGELVERQNRLAARLAAAGVAAGEVVAIWAHRSALLPLALFGILRRGAVFVILDPAYPAKRLEEFVQLARPNAVLLLAGAAPLPAELDAALPPLRLRLEAAEKESPAAAHLPAVAIGQDDLAYYAFTSGSTGKPKAILGAHGSLSAFLPFLAANFALGPGERQSMVSALSHDPLQRDVFIALCLGMTLVVPDGEELGSPGYLARWAKDERISVMNLVPAMLQLLCQDLAPEALPDLRRVFTVGEVLKRADVLRLYAAAPAALCINLYGATETQRALSYLVLPRDFAAAAENGEEAEEGSHGLGKAAMPLGRGMDGAQLLVLGPRRQLAGIGELGEICFRSRYLALGYADAEQTRERFEKNPFGSGDARDRIYHTGDLGRFLPGGSVEFAGRNDFQVKIRGFRIELQEIEACLLRHEALLEAVVLLREDPQRQGEQHLVAYFKHRSEAPSARELRELLLANLPDYMVPAAFVPLEALPRNPAGKIDREALPAPTFEARGASRRPATPNQEVLASLYAQLLGREEIFLDDDFFELGGHSLLATQLLARVRNAFGISLPLRAVFERPKLEAFAAHLAEMQGQSAKSAPLVRRPAHLQAAPPLSFAQQRLFFLEQLEPGSNAYLLFLTLRIEGALDAEALRRALGKLHHRHEALRTRIVSRDGEGCQEIAAPATGEDLPELLSRQDFSAAKADAAMASAEQRAAEIARTPIPLEADRLWRAELLRVGDDLHFFVFAIHHIVADGWSLGIFVRELGAFYQEELGLEPAQLPAIALQPADFACWERDWLRGETLANELSFWRRHLEGAPAALELPTDFLRPAMPSYRGERFSFTLPSPLAAGLRRFGREQGATLFMVLLAGFETLLAQLSGQRTVVVGTPVAHRDRTELETPIGFFANTLPLRLDIEPEIGFAELVGRLRRSLLEAFSHQDLPFEKLVAELGVERNLSRAPIFQAMFGLQNVGGGAMKWGEATLRRIEVPLGRSQFDLQWTVVDSGEQGELHSFFECSSDLFERATLERWSRRLLRLLGKALEDPQRKIAALDTRLEEDLAFVREFNETRQPFDLTLPTHHRVAQMAAENRHRPALGREGELAFTYGQLDEEANQLARCLRRHGATAESLVALAVGRLPSLVLAQLAIWKAGAAYLPLDPIFPADRLAFMLEDSGAQILLIDSRGEKAPASLLEQASLVLDLADQTAWSGEERAPLPQEQGARSLAYVLYTSGSTGKPKGVMIEHGALINFLLSMAERPGINADDRLLSLTTMSFDIAGLEIWLPLLAGARVDLAGRETLQDAESLAQAIEKTDVTFVQATPATWRLLLEGEWRGRPNLVALCGGEALPGELAERLLDKVGTLWNVYGPTETTIWSTLRRVEKGALPPVVPLGRPIANTEIRLLDRSGHEVAPGVAGELAIAGAGLARGYFARPALTAERFVPDPAAKEGGARIYRTGDLARLRQNGELEFLGRLDFQVKVRGYRIELGEIEATLEKHPSVAQAVVIATEGPGGSRLVGYYRLEEGAEVEAYALQTYLRASLPEYMVPPNLVALGVFPLTPNLKVDRKALPAPEALMDLATARPPQSEKETKLAAIWQEVLQRENVFLDDNFFALGGDSILVIQVVAKAKKQNIQIAPRHLFIAPSLEALAALAKVEGSQPEPATEAFQQHRGAEIVGENLSEEDLSDLFDSFTGG